MVGEFGGRGQGRKQLCESKSAMAVAVAEYDSGADLRAWSRPMGCPGQARLKGRLDPHRRQRGRRLRRSVAGWSE